VIFLKITNIFIKINVLNKVCVIIKKLIGISLQDFTVLPTEQFRRCVIRSLSVIFLPTSSPTDYVRQLSTRQWFPLPSLYRSKKQKNHLPMVLQTEFARQKKNSHLKYTDGVVFCRWYCDLPTENNRRLICWWVYEIPTENICLYIRRYVW